MNISGYEIDMKKAAHEIAVSYATYNLNTNDPPSEEKVSRMLQDYINAYISVMRRNQTELESLARW